MDFLKNTEVGKKSIEIRRLHVHITSNRIRNKNTINNNNPESQSADVTLQHVVCPAVSQSVSVPVQHTGQDVCKLRVIQRNREIKMHVVSDTAAVTSVSRHLTGQIASKRSQAFPRGSVTFQQERKAVEIATATL